MSIDGRELPHDIAAEQGVIGGMLLSQDAIAEVVNLLLRARDFYRPAHQIIYDIVLDLYGRGDPVDAVTVAGELTKRGEITRVGGAPYLHTLISMVPAAANAGYYAKTVAEHAARRRTLEHLQRAQQRAWNGDDVASVVESVARDLVADAEPATRGRPGDSWQPVDLGPILRGEHKAPEPTVGVARSDGLRFLYPGKEHSIIGEMESGKSWFCLASCASELVDRKHVLYIHFEEADPTDTVVRLQTLGVSDEAIRDRFRFVGPDEPVRPDRLAALLEPAPSLVVLDGVNEAMSLHGQGIREEDGAAAFRRLLVKPCTAVGAAVLSADHVVKDREKQGRGPLGSVHKGNGLSGSLIMLENAEPFGRGQRGRSHVFVTKDRPGHLRSNGRATRMPGKTFMGELVVDDTRLHRSYLDLVIWAPAEPQAEDAAPLSRNEADDTLVLSVVKTLAEEGEVNLRKVRAHSGMSATRTDNALQRLTDAGLLQETSGPNRSRLFSVSEPQPAEDAA